MRVVQWERAYRFFAERTTGFLIFLVAFVVILFVVACVLIFAVVQRRESAKPVAIVITTDTGKQMRMATTPETVSEDFSALLTHGFYTDDGTFHSQHLIRTIHVVLAGEPIPIATSIRTQPRFVRYEGGSPRAS